MNLRGQAEPFAPRDVLDPEDPDMTQTPADRSAFEAELVALIPHLRAFGRSLTGDATQGDDLAQDALAKAWAGQHSYQMGTNLKAWAFMILRNQFFSNKRRDWRVAELDQETAERTLIATEDPSGPLELDELRRAMAMLPVEHREALILIGAAGLSYEEASAVTGVAIGTVKSRVSRARDRLALIYAEGSITADGGAPSVAMAAILQQADVIRQRRSA
jgi:RNA polymerase sigma-70 factor (ECF subfamily)